jgi:hypothetical protein
MSWWNDTYVYRRRLRLTSISGPVPVDHPVTATLSISDFYDAGKTRVDYEDIEVVYDASDNPVVLGRLIDGDTSEITFNLADSLEQATPQEDIYYVYYGNPSLVDQPARPDFEENSWPYSAAFDSFDVAYTRPGEHWIDGLTEIRGATTTLQFSGSAVRVIATVGPDRGIVEIQVDDDAWVAEDSFATEESDEVIFTAEDLEYGVHKIRVRFTGESSPLATGNSFQLAAFEYAKAVTVEDLGEDINIENWESYIGQ